MFQRNTKAPTLGLKSTRRRNLGGVVVNVLDWTQRSRVRARPRLWIFKGHKNPQYIFLRMGSKAGGPTSYDFREC
jgi:hypothetical protein